MSLTQQSSAATLPADVGECSACNKRNSHRATRCHACQEVLPWALGKVKTAPQKAATEKAAKPAQRPAQKQYSDDDEDESVWWHSVGWGVLCLGVAGFSYWSFAAKEATGGYFRAKWWVVLLYSIGGKWLIAGLFIAAGLLGIAMGIMQYLQEK